MVAGWGPGGGIVGMKSSVFVAGSKVLCCHRVGMGSCHENKVAVSVDVVVHGWVGRWENGWLLGGWLLVWSGGRVGWGGGSSHAVCNAAHPLGVGRAGTWEFCPLQRTAAAGVVHGLSAVEGDCPCVCPSVGSSVDGALTWVSFQLKSV